MPNSAKMIEKLAKQLERHILLETALECETLEEFVEKLRAMMKNDN